MGLKSSDFHRLTQKQLASAFGLTDRAIRDWEDCPRNKDKSYNLPEVIKWRIKVAKDEMVGLNLPPPDPINTEALEEYRRERVLITRMERQQLEKKLGPVDEFDRALTDRAYELTRRLLLMSRRIGQRVAGRAQKAYLDVVGIIDDEVRQAMTDYARPVDLEYEPIKK